jgi:mevalonate kinase
LLKGGQAAAVTGTIIPSALRYSMSAQVQLNKQGNPSLMVDTTAATNGTNSASQI